MLSKSSVSVAIERLSNMGFIICSVDKEDRRVERINFMQEANSLRIDVKLAQINFGNVVLNGITKEEADVFFRILSKISQNATSAMREIED